MGPTHTDDLEQPLLTVKDYRSSAHNSNSSSSTPPDSTDDDDFIFEPIQPCPFIDVPKCSKYGRRYITRCSQGVYCERPLITTLHSPCKLRCWSINGPDESVHPDQLRPIVYQDQNLTVRMKDTDLLQIQWELTNMRPGFEARVGKISPLQKSYIKPLDSPRVNQPHPRRGAPFQLSKSCIRNVQTVLDNATQLMEEPCSASDSSSEKDNKLDFTFIPSTDSSDGSDINVSPPLHTERTSSSGQLQFHIAGSTASALDGATPCEQASMPLQSEQAQIVALSRRVQQLRALTDALQRELDASHVEKQRIQEQLHALQAASAAGERSTSPRASNGGANAHTKKEPRRRSGKRKCAVWEEIRLRVELMNEKQSTAEMELENGRLLGVIFKLKSEMDLEHDLVMKIEKKMAMEAFERRRQMETRVGRSLNMWRGPRGKSKYRCVRFPGRSRSQTSRKKNG
eukprot:TRINITY_DN78131_c0_g1_i1.p1 TRINITY_DN78131_c0_g1~~TRINITY_DN78131_c0_g1_i1.p1  ORF type:complete len:465 (+),score=80.67 TRINITY_DN78131_c0_g1_i1:29-1396(+)